MTTRLIKKRSKSLIAATPIIRYNTNTWFQSDTYVPLHVFHTQIGSEPVVLVYY